MCEGRSGAAVRSVLIIEDDRDVRDSIRAALEGEGYPTEVAANGREGLNRLAEGRRPGLILLDLMMPVMTGVEFLAALHADAALKGIPVVIVSARDSLPATVQAAGFLRKPLDLYALLALTATYCGSPGFKP